MSDFQRLETILRKHGFIIGALTEDDKNAIGDLLKDIWKMVDQDQSHDH